jgi:hypothetical protein
MLEQIAWGGLALVHIVPALAFFRPAILTRLYGAEAGSQLFLLLRHRAALFFSIFLACLWAIRDANARPLAALMVTLSMLSFLWLYCTSGSPKALRTIARIDIIGLPLLLIVFIGAFFQS